MAKTEEGVQDRVVLEYPTDLLKKMANEDMEELSLGLSSNGRFGVEPKQEKLARSSSIPSFNGGNGEKEAIVNNGFSSVTSLVRARSLPEEEWRKTEEMQSPRRMEAKRKHPEEEEIPMGVTDQTGDNGAGRRIDWTLDGFSWVGIWGLGSNSSGAGKASVGSQGNGSEAGNNLYGEAQSHAGNQPSPKSDQKQPVGAAKEVEIAGVGRVSQSKAKEMMSKLFVDMPIVSTMGEGPNGERVEGFLYKYRKVEDVGIVCVCHGQLFSPAEFVRHAGGGDVAYPLKHIIVSPSLS